MKNIKTVVLFRADSTLPGGMERIMLEEAEYFEKSGIKAHILAHEFDRQVLFGGSYQRDIELIAGDPLVRGRLSKIIYRITELRRRIKELKPDIVVSFSSGDAMYLYLATLLTPFHYVVHIPQAVSRGYGGLRRYAMVYRKALKEIAESVEGLGEFIPLVPSKANLTKRLAAEMMASVEYLAVRKSRKIFVFSNQMKWEVSRLYRREAIVAKGAFPARLLNYIPQRNMRQKLGLDSKRVILSINRLEPQKRIDLIIRAFSRVRKKLADAVLVIGGTGQEEEKLKSLVRELNITNVVRFVGFIDEAELWDYYASCDLFVCAHWADFNITPYGALALQKKVVWPKGIEIDENLAGNRHIFVADLNVEDYTRALHQALTTKVPEKNDLSIYTWERFSEAILNNLGISEGRREGLA
jgi:glycosyltransferase involved in cell wall biosynthesis